mmetsp:Transcript_63281/g.163593  ORF Transcript_63281/g.163593 Transcript_63281/m.163593 type:complete len:225 (-) Transcript_63281:69-743(-)
MPLRREPLAHIAFEVPGAIKVRVPRVDDLHKQVAALDTTPELPPEVEISFVRRHHDMLLRLEQRKVPAPIQEGLALSRGELLCAACVLPQRPPRNGDDDARGRQLHPVARRIRIAAFRHHPDKPTARVLHRVAPALSLRREDSAGERGLGQEVVQAALLQHGPLGLDLGDARGLLGANLGQELVALPVVVLNGLSQARLADFVVRLPTRPPRRHRAGAGRQRAC